MKKQWMTIGLVLVLAGHAHAQQVAVVAETKVDKPLRDPSICRAKDGTYYLTGTSAAAGDFLNNDGIYLWKSPDLKSWSPLGKVWNLRGAQDRGNALRWTQYLRLNPAAPASFLLDTSLILVMRQ